jgi:hypothetical protein
MEPTPEHAMTDADRHTPEERETRLGEIDLEIARQAVICKVKLFDPGVVERVLAHDTQVCGADHPVAFETLRALLVMHYTEGRRLAEALSPEQAGVIAHDVRERLRRRLGRQLGGPAA